MTRRLLLLLGFAVIGVILNHSTVYGFNALFFWSDPSFPQMTPTFEEHGTLPYYGLSLIKRVIAFGVPVFLFVSGYFIAFAAGRKQPKIKWEIIRARITNLLIPYLIWSVAIFLGQAMVYGRIASAREYVLRLVFGGATTAYYYVPLLIQMYLLSPFLVPLAKNNWKRFLLIAAIVQLIAEGLSYASLLGIEIPGLQLPAVGLPLWFFPRRIFWFAFGMVFGFHSHEFKSVLVRARKGLVIATVIFLVVSFAEFEILLGQSGHGWIGSFGTFSNALYSGAFILSFLSFEQLSIPFSRQLTELGTKSYGIYLLNDQVLELTGVTLFRLARWILSYQLLYQVIMIAAGLGIPLLLMMLISKSPARKTYRYLFG